MSYIKSGIVSKAAASPLIHTYPDTWKELDKKADELEEKLDNIRAIRCNRTGRKIRGSIPMTDEARTIIKELSKIDAEMHTILMQANPEYRIFWFGE